jgi:maleate isomerase
MIGYRAKFGVMLSPRNFTLEPEFYQLAPEGVSFHFHRMGVASGGEGETPKEVETRLKGFYEDTGKCAKMLSDIQPDVISFACTSGSLYGGRDYDKNIIERIEQVARVPATTTSTAVIRALKDLELKKLTVVTPYIPEVNKKVSSFLEAHDIEVNRIEGLSMEANRVGNVTLKSLEIPQKVYRLAQKIDTEESTGVFIACTALRTIEILEPLEQDLKKPVVSANQATVWMMMRMAKVNVPIKGYGCLFEL